MTLISISIDLSGSTYAKQALVEFSADDDALRKRLYGELLKILFNMEREFYLSVINNEFIDFSKLFLVKSIGDEYWFIYRVDDADGISLGKTAWGFFDSLLSLFAAQRYLVFDISGGLDAAGPFGDDNRSLREFDLPIKAHIDLIHEPIEVNLERYKYLKDVTSYATGKNPAVYNVDPEYIELCNRLNLGSPAVFGNTHKVQSRTDYIGLEIDRFFRVTALCHPLLLCVGDALMDKLSYEVEPAMPGKEHLGVKTLAINLLGDDGKPQSVQRKYLIPECVGTEKMKGVGEDYKIYHIFGSECLGDAVFAPPPSIETLMAQTRSFLAEHGFYALDLNNLLP